MNFVFHQLLGDSEVCVGIHTAANLDSEGMLRFANSYSHSGMRCRVYTPCLSWWDSEKRRWRKGSIVHETPVSYREVATKKEAA